MSREDILYPTMKDKYPEINYDNIGLGNYNKEKLSREDIFYPTMKSRNNNRTLTGGFTKIAADEISGVKKGEPMTIEEAIKGVNPDYNSLGNPTYKTNCQASVIIFDARLRGYDIEVNIGYENDIKNKLSERPNIVFVDPKTGKVPEFTQTKAKNGIECLNWLDNNINQGERYLFAFQWKQKSYNNEIRGHIITILRDKNNQLKFYDPQIAKARNPEFLDRIQYKFDWTEEHCPPKILRVDDKELNKKMLNQISKPARKTQ